MFGYECQECGEGTVKETKIKDYEARLSNCSFIVPEAIIGVCDICGAQHFDANETKKWREYFVKAFSDKLHKELKKEVHKR